MNNDVWFYIPGFNGYQINKEGLVRSMKMMYKNPGHILKKDKSGKYTLTNDNNERVRVSSEELMNITFNQCNDLRPAMQNEVYLGGRNKVFTKDPHKKEIHKETYKIDLSSKVR